MSIVAAAAKSLQLCPTLCDPTDGSHQAPPSLGFSRQEHWSGLPFPSPMHESEKWKGSRSVVSQLLATPWTAAYQAPPSMGFSRRSTGVGCHCLLLNSCWHTSNSSFGGFLELSVISPTPKRFLSAVDEELTGYQHFSLVLLFVEPL